MLKSNKKWIPLIIVFSAFLNSCLFNFIPIKVTTSIDNNKDYYNDDKIIVSFSYDVDTELTEKIISLKSDGKTLDLEYTWENNKCIIRPKNKWIYGNRYQFVINGYVQTISNGGFDVNINNFFYYGEEGQLLELLNYSTKENKLVSGTESLIFEFNKKVNQISFKDNFSLSPNIDFLIEFNDTSVIITPKDKWPVNKNFKWSISNITANDDYILLKKYNDSFYTESDLDLPVLESIWTVEVIDNEYFWVAEDLDNLNINNCIGFKFSKPMNEESLATAINFTPSLKGQFIENPNGTGKEYIYVPSSPLLIDTEYRIVLDTNAKDENDIPLLNEEEISFKCANDYLEVISVFMNEYNQSEKSIIYQKDSENTINEIVVPEDSKKDIIFTIEFSTAIDTKKQQQIAGFINLSSYFPLSNETPVLTKVSWNQTKTQISFTYHTFSRSDDSKNCYYQIKITGGQKGCSNSNNEYLKEDICVTFITK